MRRMILRAAPFLTASLLAAAAPVAAHNEPVHQRMTDRAYQIMIALAAGALSTSGDAELPALAEAAQRALPKLRGLPAGLPPPKQSRCIDPEAIRKFLDPPQWGAATPWESTTLGAVRFPISSSYIVGSDCGIDPTWSRGAFFDGIPIPEVEGPDHTGVVLGFWACRPDHEKDDWHVFLRSTNTLGLSHIKDYIETAAGAGAGTVWVTVRCALTCLESAITLGIAGKCKECLDEAIAEAQQAVHEAVTTVDGLAPGVGDYFDAEMLSGMGHHLNVAPGGAPGPWKLNPAAADDRPGLLLENAGPFGWPDSVEFLALFAADHLGVTVNYDDSLAPKRYQVRGAHDFHPDSADRDEDDWEWLSMSHTHMTPLDNLAFYGWKSFRDAPRENVPKLGWALHTFGDAIVPMHVAGTFGWGHRPYEDAFANRLSRLLWLADEPAAKTQAQDIAKRAVVWRRRILEWRAQHPERGTDIPIRDLVTQLATWTWQRIEGPGMLAWPYNPVMFSWYLSPWPYKESSIFYYEKAPGADAVNEDLLREGIAAELAFLVSAAEAVP